ncbi:MAG: Uma2 family endonuclease [Acidobacteriota bacterium]|nr:Uma2 family endonuclease [Acidobacteriota bacterium]
MPRLQERATYEDLLKVPENMIAELIDGEVFASPRPSGPHTNAASVLVMLIGSAYQIGTGGPGGWWIQVEPEVHLGRDVLVPDIAGWRRVRMPEVPRNHVYSVRPDWTCEVLSHSTARVDREKKLPIYAQHGVAHAWLVDVDQQMLEVKRLVEGRWTDAGRFGGGEIIRAEPFEAIEIDMKLVWGPPPA